MSKTGAQLMIAALIDEGVKVMFGVAGRFADTVVRHALRDADQVHSDPARAGRRQGAIATVQGDERTHSTSRPVRYRTTTVAKRLSHDCYHARNLPRLTHDQEKDSVRSPAFRDKSCVPGIPLGFPLASARTTGHYPEAVTIASKAATSVFPMRRPALARFDPP